MSTDAFAKPDPAADDEDIADRHIADALGSLRQAIDRFSGCTAEEKEALRRELAELQAMDRKLREGRVEIVLFGEIDTGKSALINALVGRTVAAVDVRGGWTKEVWDVPWEAHGVCVPGLDHSQIVLLDTPGINEVAGEERAVLARNAATRADLVLFVTDSDLNQTEYAALADLAACHKPILLVFNKTDNYTPEQRATLRATFADGRLARHCRDGRHRRNDGRSRCRGNTSSKRPTARSAASIGSPQPNVETLKLRILEVLARDGKALLALNAAMYAADRSDRIATVKVRMRDERANAIIWSYAAMKSVGVAVSAVPVADIVGGSALDMTMVVTLAHVYGIPLTWVNAQRTDHVDRQGGRLGHAQRSSHTPGGLGLQGADLRRRPSARCPAARGGRRIRLVHCRTGRKVLPGARSQLGRRSAEERRGPHSGRDGQTVRRSAACATKSATSST